MSNNYLTWFSDLDPLSAKTHLTLIKLAYANFPVAPGFIITSEAYFTFLKENNLDHKIKQLLSTISIDHSDSLMQGERHIKKLFEQAQLSDEFIVELTNFYQKLGKNEVIVTLHEKESQRRKHTTIQVLSEYQLVKEIKNVWAEMFASQALWHRHHRKLNHLETAAEIIVQKKIAGHTTGTIITVDPITHEKNKLVITVTHPHIGDTYVLSKKNLTILDRTISYKNNIPKLSHDDILNIGQMAKDVEQYLYFPQEIQWTLNDGQLFLLNVKPVTTLPEQRIIKTKKLPIARGKRITDRIGTGIITYIHSEADLLKSKPHDVIVISNLELKHIKNLTKPRAIIVESSYLPTHISILLKQHGIPTIANVKNAKKQLRNGYVVTVNAGKGEIYLGGLP